ncbi:FMN-linked oxidoreductase [Lactarius indigo]|nr:FMN-linked oxidoreductase [Lactarius indigo]
MPNALVKAAMYEHMASLFGGLPNANHFALYSLWSQGGWGMIVTGNVQVSQDHLTLGRDMVVPKTITSDALRSYAALASAMRPDSENPRTLSPIIIGGRLLTPPFAPSALGIGRNEHSSAHLSWFARLVYNIGFQTPRAMSVQDIDHLIDRFVLSARLAHDAGFDGVELHASHGYLLAQFISPKSNIRDDTYGAPLHLLERIVSSIRKVLPRPFVLGIKLSSSDYVGAGSLYNAQVEEEAKNRALAHVISGGDYENPEFMTSRQAFFARFARKARDAIHAQAPSFSPTSVFEDALSQGHADLVGIGRASVLVPRLPLLLRKLYSGRAAGDLDGEKRRRIWLGILPLPTLIGAGAAMAWYVVTMSRTSRGSEINYQMGAIRVVLTMWIPELRTIALLPADWQFPPLVSTRVK